MPIVQPYFNEEQRASTGLSCRADDDAAVSDTPGNSHPLSSSSRSADAVPNSSNHKAADPNTVFEAENTGNVSVLDPLSVLLARRAAGSTNAVRTGSDSGRVLQDGHCKSDVANSLARTNTNNPHTCLDRARSPPEEHSNFDVAQVLARTSPRLEQSKSDVGQLTQGSPRYNTASALASKTASTAADAPGGHWHCELCRSPLLPVLGGLARPLQLGQGKRHHCRSCSRTICGTCSFKVDGRRTCRICQTVPTVLDVTHPQRAKIVFFVRHAESVWNVAMASGARSVAMHALEKDHPLSEEGKRQCGDFKAKVASGLSTWGGQTWASDTAEAERVRQFYHVFLARRNLIFSSPLLRALQTAHLAFPTEDGWGTIQLLKDAREHFRFVTERDCKGAESGDNLIARAQNVGGLQDVQRRIDCNDCVQQWWSDTPETGAELDHRHKALWKKVLADNVQDSCVLVTHSNFIRGVLSRFSAAMPTSQERHSHGYGGGISSSSSADGYDTLRQATQHKLQNNGVLGVKCVSTGVVPGPRGGEEQWIATDALLMFGSSWQRNR